MSKPNLYEAAEAGFLPPNPPVPVARWLAWFVIGLVGVAGLFAVAVKLPETVRSPFVLIPEQGADPLQAPLAAEIRRISVAPGDEVVAGTELLALNSREILGWQTQLKTAQQDLQAAHERAKKLEQVHSTLMKIKDEEIAQAEQEVKFCQKHTETVRDFVRRANILATDGLISAVELLRSQLEQAEVEKNLLLAQKTLQQVHLQREQVEAERARQRIGEEADIGKDMVQIQSLQRQLEQCQNDEWIVRAPYHAVVISLTQRTSGNVVQPGQELCQLARVEGQPLAWLLVPESAVGRLAKGQSVKLFFAAFPYQRHGTVPATIRWVSPAAVKMGEDRTFVAQATLDALTLPAGAQGQKLRIGMKGEARVSVGHRTLVEYAFEPIRQLRENFRR